MGIRDSRRGPKVVLSAFKPIRISGFPFFLLAESQAGRDVAKTKFLLSLAFHVVQTSIRGTQQLFDGGAVGGKHRQSHADGYRRILTVGLQFVADAVGYLADFFRS